MNFCWDFSSCVHVDSWKSMFLRFLLCQLYLHGNFLFFIMKVFTKFSLFNEISARSVSIVIKIGPRSMRRSGLPRESFYFRLYPNLPQNSTRSFRKVKSRRNFVIYHDFDRKMTLPAKWRDLCEVYGVPVTLGVAKNSRSLEFCGESTSFHRGSPWLCRGSHNFAGSW